MMMKKYLTIGSTILMLSTSTFATDVQDSRRGAYLKFNVGANKLNDAKDKIEDINKSLNSKSEISPYFLLGTGIYINDFIRTDIIFDYSKVSFKDAKANHTYTTNDKYYTDKHV